MPKSLQELAGQLRNEALPTAGQDMEDLPSFGGWTQPPPAATYRLKLPKEISNVYEPFDVPDKQPPQRIRAHFDKDHPLLIVQSPGGKLNGEPFETRVTNNERARGKDKSVVASEMDYLLRACGVKNKPGNNLEYVQVLSQQGGKEFTADLKYSWRCNRDRDIRVRDDAGAVQVVEGKKGCGEAYYQEDVSKNADGSVPYEVKCSRCGAWLRAWANLENMREK